MGVTRIKCHWCQKQIDQRMVGGTIRPARTIRPAPYDLTGRPEPLEALSKYFETNSVQLEGFKIDQAGPPCPVLPLPTPEISHPQSTRGENDLPRT